MTPAAIRSARWCARPTRPARPVTYSVLQRNFDLRNRLNCEARRMNPAQFAVSLLPASACDRDNVGTAPNDFGFDRITQNIYDAAGQLLQERRGVDTPLLQTYARYTYTLNGRRASVTDANGNRAELRYDGHDRLSRWVFPSRTTDGAVNEADYEEYGYDAAGNRTSLRKRDGSTLTYSYDALDRMTRKTVPEREGLAPTHTRDVFYGYNVLDLQTFARFDSTSGEGVTNSYDALGRLLTTTTDMTGPARSVTRVRDDVANRIHLTYGGQTYRYDLDDAGRLTGLYEDDGTPALLAGLTYTARGQVDFRNGGNSDVDYGYDRIGRLDFMTHTFAGGAGDVTLDIALYNPASQIDTRTRDNDDYAWNGGVDVSRSYTVNGLNQYTAAGGTTFAYDANGNLTRSGSTNYVYDVENRLVSASGGQTASLRYDPLGRLFEVGGAAPSRRLLWDGDALVAEYTTSGSLAARYVHGTAEGVDDPLVWYGGGENRRLHADHLGSIVAITDGSGAIKWINGYDEWGIPNAPSNSGRFQYTGQLWIGELGMYHYKARIYSPTLGRFLQVDPVGYDDQVHLYAYVLNDPLNHVDVTGQQARTVHLPAPGGCMGCHSTTTPSQTPPARVPVQLPDIGGVLRQIGNFLCTWICSATTDNDPVRTDSTGKVHGELPDADDVDSDDIEDSIDALDESIETRQAENRNFSDGRRNGSPEQRRQWQVKQQHRERIAAETRLRDGLRRRLEDER
jgi:RHS repeat-associated protein